MVYYVKDFGFYSEGSGQSMKDLHEAVYISKRSLAALRGKNWREARDTQEDECGGFLDLIGR